MYEVTGNVGMLNPASFISASKLIKVESMCSIQVSVTFFNMTSIRDQVWKYHVGTAGHSKCTVLWCTNRISDAEFEVLPYSSNSSGDMRNLRPVCMHCYKAINHEYTIEQWNKQRVQETEQCCCFGYPFW